MILTHIHHENLREKQIKYQHISPHHNSNVVNIVSISIVMGSKISSQAKANEEICCFFLFKLLTSDKKI